MAWNGTDKAPPDAPPNPASKTVFVPSTRQTNARRGGRSRISVDKHGSRAESATQRWMVRGHDSVIDQQKMPQPPGLA